MLKFKVFQMGKITIPIEVREALGKKEGVVLALEVLGGCITLIPS